MPVRYIHSNIEVIPDFSVNDPRARDIASLYLNETGEDGQDPELVDDELAHVEASTVVIAIGNNEEILSVAALKRMKDVPEGVVTTVATSSEHHTEGLATQVMSRLAQEAKGKGMTYLHAYPWLGSRAFYLSQGFEHEYGKSFNPSWVTKKLN